MYGTLYEILKMSQYTDPNYLEVQKKTILEYKQQNTLIYGALANELTIEGVVKDMKKIHRGFGFIMPHRKDIEHNNRLEELAELIPSTEYLKTRGLFVPDNFVSYFTAGAVITASGIWAPGIAVGALFGGLINISARTHERGMDPAKFARYIDDRISELFSYPL